MTLGATTSGLVHIASLTNDELFTEVIAEINRSFKKEKKSNKKKDWQRIALKVATSAAKGEEEGYCCADDWVKQFNRLSSDEDSTVSQASNFREALNSLPSDCYRRRLDNALKALASSSHSTDNLSVKQVAGLIRGCTFLTSSISDTDTDTKDLQTRVISHLVKSMPQLASNPFDIFYAVQLPLLQKLNYDTFIKGGMKFASQDSETEFISLLNLDYLSEQQGKQAYKAGEKRKRISDDNNKMDTCSPNTDVSRKTIHHVLEAAYLARKGAVRAQHGAVIYIKEGDTTKVIGRGWNHDYLLDPSASKQASKKNKIVLHSEVHAVVDAISNYGEDECFDKLFPMAYIMIVELEGDYAYDTCHPCPKCDPMLRAVGITKVLHTTPHGKIEELGLGLANYDLLANENVYTHLIAACDERKITCKRLQL